MSELHEAPCKKCGYNGPGFYQPSIHRCPAEISHPSKLENDALRESVNHPSHYGGKDNPYEAIKVIEARGLGFCLGNTVKYLARAGKKSAETALQDLEKAQWYLDREIQQRKGTR